jgi:hypothetical protein
MAGILIYKIKTTENVFSSLLKDGCRCGVGFHEITVTSSEAKQRSAVTTIPLLVSPTISVSFCIPLVLVLLVLPLVRSWGDVSQRNP